MGLNPFRSIDKVEAIRKEAEKKKIDEQIKSCVDNAKHILSSEWGTKYRDDMNKTKDEVIRYLVRNVNPDPVKDAFFTRCALTKLAVIMDMLEGVEIDGKK